MIEVINERDLKEVIALLLTPAYKEVLGLEEIRYTEHSSKYNLCCCVQEKHTEGYSYDKIVNEFGDQITKCFPFVKENRLFGLDGHDDMDSFAAETILLKILEDDGVPFIIDAPLDKEEECMKLLQKVRAFDGNKSDAEWMSFYRSIRPEIAFIIGEEDV